MSLNFITVKYFKSGVYQFDYERQRQTSDLLNFMKKYVIARRTLCVYEHVVCSVYSYCVRATLSCIWRTLYLHSISVP